MCVLHSRLISMPRVLPRTPARASSPPVTHAPGPKTTTAGRRGRSRWLTYSVAFTWMLALLHFPTAH